MKVGKLYIQFYDDNEYHKEFSGHERVIFEYLENDNILILSEIKSKFNTFPIEQGRKLPYENIHQKVKTRELEDWEIIKYKLLGYIK